MDEPPQARQKFWKKYWNSPFVFLLAIGVAAFLILLIGGLVFGMNHGDSQWIAKLAGVALVPVVAVAIGLVLPLLFNRRYLAKLLLGLIILIPLFYLEEDLRGKAAWNRFQREWMAEGEKFDFKSFVPPPVPDARNFALTPIVASSYASMLDANGHHLHPINTNIVDQLAMNVYRSADWENLPTNGNWSQGTITDLKPWQAYYCNADTNSLTGMLANEFPVAPTPQSPAADVLFALGKYDAAIEEVRQASALPDSRFPLGYDSGDPMLIWLPHLGPLRQCSVELQLRSIAELQTGQTDKAAADIKLILHLADSIHAEPFLFSHLVRLIIVNNALQPIYEGLADRKWSDAQLATLDSELAGFDFIAEYRHSMRAELALMVNETEYVRHSPKLQYFFSDHSASSGPDRGLALLYLLSPSGWFEQNKIQFSRFFLEDWLPIADVESRQISPKAAQEAQAKLNRAMAFRTPYNVLETVFLSRLNEAWFDGYVAATKFAYAQESVDLARVAIALERRRLAQDDYPESLEVLAPKFLEKVPHDIIGGQPLKYRRTGNTFILYSIGWNEIDDGGTPSPPKGRELDWSIGDWVWHIR
jgi:hypothetical protein